MTADKLDDDAVHFGDSVGNRGGCGLVCVVHVLSHYTQGSNHRPLAHRVDADVDDIFFRDYNLALAHVLAEMPIVQIPDILSLLHW